MTTPPRLADRITALATSVRRPGRRGRCCDTGPSVTSPREDHAARTDIRGKGLYAIIASGTANVAALF